VIDPGPDVLGGGSSQTTEQQKASGAFCAAAHQGGQPVYVPPNTPAGPEWYEFIRLSNTVCPVDP
jgi:hypothetical protein